MRRLILWLDGLLSRHYGVFSFTDDPDCLLRFGVTGAPHALVLPGCRIPAGEPVLILHLWNGHMPPIPAAGSTILWAARFGRKLERSFHLAASAITVDARLASLRAVGGIFSLLPADEASGSVRLMHRLGFTVVPTRHRLGRFGEFWENFYAWGLLWAYNPGSLRGRSPFSLHRSEVWMGTEEFLSRYSLCDGA